ncbi:Oidioi.mRNA.OKI2018_I69.chr2.g5289.t1.cds [Oikopleura dioica]|uniref:Oidioi.mRNA.OKI2018_I69.chr2.g5289.t1.cds n=1 Tax=Oikopleura dioica TaxID=34765 RepID=A0ABN7T1K6_OIKDI|nr:Oidioi.mRNA.OKI2018_I69.chr2.g5289.t1.cds [Oikopleura dioica]
MTAKCENCLCQSPDCLVGESSVVSIGSDGDPADGVDLACQNGKCLLVLSHSVFNFNSQKYYICEAQQSLEQSDTFIAIDSTASNETQSTISRIFDDYKPYIPANPFLISNSNWAYCPFPDLSCEEFSFSCENGVEIMMDEICFKRKYPALDLVNFNNSASPFNDSCIWSQDTDDFRVYKLDLSIDDKDCREQAIYSGDDIIYTWSFFHTSPLVALGFQNADLTYTFNCTFDKNEIFFFNGTVEPPATIADVTDIPDPVPDQPIILLNDEPFDAENQLYPVVASSDIMTFDFSAVFTTLGEYRIDMCEVKSENAQQSSKIIENGCATTVFQSFVTIDPFAQIIKTPPVTYLSSPTSFHLECTLLFCDDCVNLESSCPAQGNEEIIVQFTRSKSIGPRQEKEKTSISASISDSDSLIQVEVNQTTILVDRKFKDLFQTSSSLLLAPILNLFSTILFLFLLL